ncbi:MAG: methyltransferase domain-containing protein [Cyclobacteriaceae bacterium]|jgi:2-polyprenyl-3-methyl-5-hydroxy-6-metoxy-1,4-benzoquinol methylase|nr:methyltransferase domain-containing protein [Cyclobacteriaceae bacterium]
MAEERLTPGTLAWEKYSADHLQRYHYFGAHYAGKSVLDIACGVGYGSAIIHQLGATRVCGVDISEEAITFAKKNYSRSIEFVQSDYRALAADQPLYDLIVSFETLEHLPEPGDFLEKMSRLLKPGGSLLCSTPNKQKFSAQGIHNPFHVNELTLTEFREVFSRYFHITGHYRQDESLPFQRFQYLKKNILELHFTIQSTPYMRVKNAIKRLLGKPVVNFLSDITDATVAEDFVIRPIEGPAEDASVFILMGEKRTAAPNEGR